MLQISLESARKMTLMRSIQAMDSYQNELTLLRLSSMREYVLSVPPLTWSNKWATKWQLDWQLLLLVFQSFLEQTVILI
jgi:hypothetical protein